MEHDEPIKSCIFATDSWMSDGRKDRGRSGILKRHWDASSGLKGWLLLYLSWWRYWACYSVSFYKVRHECLNGGVWFDLPPVLLQVAPRIFVTIRQRLHCTRIIFSSVGLAYTIYLIFKLWTINVRFIHAFRQYPPGKMFQTFKTKKKPKGKQKSILISGSRSKNFSVSLFGVFRSTAAAEGDCYCNQMNAEKHQTPQINSSFRTERGIGVRSSWTARLGSSRSAVTKASTTSSLMVINMLGRGSCTDSFGWKHTGQRE